jgi:glucose-1-phosphatase
MAAVQFVYFDLGNVLAKFDVDRACRNLHGRWGIEPAEVFEKIWTSGLQDRFEHGEVNAEQFTEIIRSEFGLAATASPTEELLDLLSDMFDPVEEMVEVVDAVRRSGIAMGILSNTCHAHWEWLRRQKYAAIAGPFHRVILSYEHGAMKPHPSLYRIATEMAGVPAEAILFFDDRTDNVVAAAEAGWQSYQFTDAASAREVLRLTAVLR